MDLSGEPTELLKVQSPQLILAGEGTARPDMGHHFHTKPTVFVFKCSLRPHIHIIKGVLYTYICYTLSLSLYIYIYIFIYLDSIVQGTGPPGGTRPVFIIAFVNVVLFILQVVCLFVFP